MHKLIRLLNGRLLALLPLIVMSAELNAQQMIVDDAEVAAPRSIQIESWYGTEESWFQPGVSLASGLEVSPAIIFDSHDNNRPANWVIESKLVPGNLELDGWAFGLVGALVFDFDGNAKEFYSYIPFSKMILNHTSVIHLNVGVEGANLGSVDRESAITTGIRGDFGITHRFMILSELFAADFESAAFQIGFRFTLLPDLLEMDITYGEGFQRGMDYPGFNVGIAFTPNQIW